jgi:hypothetical protein
LYLKKKTENFLETIITKYNFFPKNFAYSIKIECFLLKNPVITFFLICLLGYLFFLQMVSLFQYLTLFFFRTFFFTPFILFRNIFNENIFKKRSKFLEYFLEYAYYYKKVQNNELKKSRTTLLGFSLITIVLAFKKAQMLSM